MVVLVFIKIVQCIIVWCILGYSWVGRVHPRRIGDCGVEGWIHDEEDMDMMSPSPVLLVVLICYHMCVVSFFYWLIFGIPINIGESFNGELDHNIENHSRLGHHPFQILSCIALYKILGRSEYNIYRKYNATFSCQSWPI